MNTIFPFNMLKKRTRFDKHALYLENVFSFSSFDHFKYQNSLFVEWKGTFFYQSKNIALKGKHHNISNYIYFQDVKLVVMGVFAYHVKDVKNVT